MKLLQNRLILFIIGLNFVFLLSNCGSRGAQGENVERTNAVTIIDTRSNEINTHLRNIDAAIQRNDYNEVQTQAERIQVAANEVRVQAEYLDRNERKSITEAADQIVLNATQLKNYAREGSTKQNQVKTTFNTLQKDYETFRSQLITL